jgi:hypothetical protein
MADSLWPMACLASIPTGESFHRLFFTYKFPPARPSESDLFYDE